MELTRPVPTDHGLQEDELKAMRAAIQAHSFSTHPEQSAVLWANVAIEPFSEAVVDFWHVVGRKVLGLEDANPFLPLIRSANALFSRSLERFQIYAQTASLLPGERFAQNAAWHIPDAGALVVAHGVMPEFAVGTLIGRREKSFKRAEWNNGKRGANTLDLEVSHLLGNGLERYNAEPLGVYRLGSDMVMRPGTNITDEPVQATQIVVSPNVHSPYS